MHICRDIFQLPKIPNKGFALHQRLLFQVWLLNSENSNGHCKLYAKGLGNCRNNSGSAPVYHSSIARNQNLNWRIVLICKTNDPLTRSKSGKNFQIIT